MAKSDIINIKDFDNQLVVIKGDDKTSDTQSLHYIGKQCHLSFRDRGESGHRTSKETTKKSYPYSRENVEYFEAPRLVHLYGKKLYLMGQETHGATLLRFFDRYCRIYFEDRSQELRATPQVRVEIVDPQAQDKNQVFAYFRDLLGKALGDDGYLPRVYWRDPKSIHNNSVLNTYLSRQSLKVRSRGAEECIYPFGFNLSQISATQNAFRSNISRINGPPGTGKTQTILNIIANAVIQNKSVAIVSNNNSAVDNVFEKLQAYNLHWLVARLGKRSKREEFFEELPEQETIRHQWTERHQSKNLSVELTVKKIKRLKKALELKNNIAVLQVRLDQWRCEMDYFLSLKGSRSRSAGILLEFQKKGPISSKTLDQLWRFVNQHHADLPRLKWRARLEYWFRFRRSPRTLQENTSNEITRSLYTYCYSVEIQKLRKQLERYRNQLKELDFDENLNTATSDSLWLFKDTLYARFKKMGQGQSFDIENYRSHFSNFVHEYPVILSTTYALRDSIGGSNLVDLLIMDEASQVDLLSGSLP